MPLLTVHNLTKRFAPEAAPVVGALSFTVAEGEIFALLGPSGCGKTTTLRMLAGFETPDAGTITLGDQVLSEGPQRRVPPEQRGIGMVFQDYALFPHLSVLDNVRFGLQAWPRRERDARARDVLRLVGLAGFEQRRPHELSGGQQQRVAIARTLAPTPRLVLLDEPFSNLDALLRQSTRQDIRTLLKQAGVTAILVTHDQEEALSFADRVAVMRNGQIEQVGTPEAVYYQPRTLFVAQFLGRTNLLLSEAAGTEAETPLGRVRLNRAATGPVLLSLRPEHLTLEAPQPGATSACAVVGREFKGHDITFRILLDGQEYLVHTPNNIPFQPGDQVVVRPLEPAVVLEGTG
jgi:iron(III) transport system ATP-binding protein